MQTVYGLMVLSEQAREWIDENVNAEPWQWMGDTFGIEHRYIADIVEAMMQDGLVNNRDFAVA